MVNVDALKSPGALRRWLGTRDIDFGRWGEESAKSVADLWLELENGETRLVDDPPRRLVHVVQVIIRRGEKILVETAQEFGDGRHRARYRPPSDKMRTGETPREAAVRCLHEELGLLPRHVTLLPAGRVPESVTADSPSYPGLLTLYTFHTLEAIVNGLPEGEFWRENAAFDGEGDPVRRHRWDWRPAEERPTDR